MNITITVSERELKFLQKVAGELGRLQQQTFTVSDAVHECIRMALYDEGEETAEEEGM